MARNAPGASLDFVDFLEAPVAKAADAEEPPQGRDGGRARTRHACVTHAHTQLHTGRVEADPPRRLRTLICTHTSTTSLTTHTDICGHIALLIKQGRAICNHYYTLSTHLDFPKILSLQLAFKSFSVASYNNTNNNNGLKVLSGVRRRHRGPPFALEYHQFIIIN